MPLEPIYHSTTAAVFAGASAALIVVTTLGAAGGQVLEHLIPDGVLDIFAALAFVAMGVLVAREAYTAGNGASDGEACDSRVDGQTECTSNSAWD